MLNVLVIVGKQKRYNHMDYSVLIEIGDSEVELQGVEPWSKHIRRKLSTCLLLHYLSGNGRGNTNQPDP